MTFWRVVSARLAALFSIHMRATSSNVCVAAKISSYFFLAGPERIAAVRDQALGVGAARARWRG